MRKIIAVGGQPGTGKTTLFRKFMEGKTWEKVEPKKMLPALYSKELDLYILGKYEDGERYIERGSDQSETFLKGRATKYSNLLSNFELMPYITEFSNTNLEEQGKVLAFLENNFKM